MSKNPGVEIIENRKDDRKKTKPNNHDVRAPPVYFRKEGKMNRDKDMSVGLGAEGYKGAEGAGISAAWFTVMTEMLGTGPGGGLGCPTWG